MTTMKLAKESVLEAVAKAISPWSIYIGEEVNKAHRASVAAGNKGHPPKAALILRRLNQLAESGLLEKSTLTNGYYGYQWTITPAGRGALARMGQV